MKYNERSLTRKFVVVSACVKKNQIGAGKMAHQVRPIAALSGDLSLVPSPYVRQLETIFDSCSRGSEASASAEAHISKHN